AGGVRLELPGQIKVDLVLQDFLDHDRQLVATPDLDQRASATVQRLHSLLNQCRQLKATTHLVDNGFFLQFIQHFSPFEVQPWRTFPQRGEERARPPRSAAVGENSPKFSDPETCSVYGRTDNCTDLACGCSFAIRKRHANTTSRLYRDRPKSR